ncbi:hypothetical protein CCACVL1_27970, partial [Corchorus capsularis]
EGVKNFERDKAKVKKRTTKAAPK